MSTNKNEKKKSETKNEVAIPQPAGGSVEGNIETSDMVVPSLKLAAKMGELGELFIPGSLVLNQEYALYGARTDDRTNPKEDPVWLTVLHAKKSYYERTEYGSDTVAKTADTMDEMLEQGGSLDWGAKGEKPTWNPKLTCTVIIRGDDEAYFPFEFDGKKYALARWSLQSISAYRAAAKQILTAAALNLRAGLEYGSWGLTSTLKKSGTNSFHVPVLTTGEKNDEKFATWARELAR
tara:strand:+ start:945 stop:1652 length:708 start_codon:yes stop_codon:yes gene_type:complete